MSQRKRWLTVLGAGGALALGCGGLAYWQAQENEKARLEVVRLEKQATDDRKLIAAVPSLEREVIVERETDEVIREILPSERDVNEYVRTLQGFADQAEVQISSLKQRPPSKEEKAGKVDFQKVGYQVSFPADAFQLLSFLDQVERYQRFMSVNTLKLTAAKRQNRARKNDNEQEGPIRHDVQLEVETYVHIPAEKTEGVQIDNYDRKRELLASEIAQRRASLSATTYAYSGQRNRRDPWMDPRVPASTEPNILVPIEQQIAFVDGLVVRAAHAQDLWRTLTETESPIAQMKAQSQLEEELVSLEEEVRRIEASGDLSYAPAYKRFRTDVAAVVHEIREQLDGTTGSTGPSEAALREAADSMQRHMDTQEYELALAVFAAVEPTLALAEPDGARGKLVEEIRALEERARTILDFERLDLKIGGVIIQGNGPSVALINGRALGVGDMLDGDLVIQAIREEEIEFLFRGIVLAHPVGR